jgi:hypothetical protein
MTDGQIWFTLVAGAILVLLLIAGFIDALTKNRINRMAVDSIAKGGYTRDEIDRIIMQWASEDAPEE